MKKLILLALLLALPQGARADEPRRGTRALAGIIYFTNNTPRDLDTFPVELYTRDRRRRLAATRADARGNFEITGVAPGKYLLKFTWPPDRCALWYRVDVRKDSKTGISVVMDAACSGHDGAVRDLPEG